jgi:hypothetical protein
MRVVALGQQLPIVAVLENCSVAHQSAQSGTDVFGRKQRESQQAEIGKVQMLVDMQA